MNELVEMKAQSRALSNGILNPANLHEALEMAGVLCKSSLIPKDFQGNAGNVLVAIQWGMELGLAPMQALQSIAVINGRPSLWGDAVIALCKAHPVCEWVREYEGGDTAVCVTQRRGDPEPVERRFSMDDAKRAGLLGKPGPWTQYPRRMLQMRARSWCLRDAYPDLLRGMAVAEEQQDRVIIDAVPAPVASTASRTDAIKARMKHITRDNSRDVSTLHAVLRDGENVDAATGEIVDADPIADLLAAITEAGTREELEAHRAAVAALKAEQKRRAIDAWKAAEARIATAA